MPLYYGTPDGYTQHKILPSITVEDLDYTGDAINGFTIHPDSTPLQDASTMEDGNVVALDETVENNHRLVIRKEWIEQNISLVSRVPPELLSSSLVFLLVVLTSRV